MSGLSALVMESPITEKVMAFAVNVALGAGAAQQATPAMMALRARAGRKQRMRMDVPESASEVPAMLLCNK
jgi:hypothetical protein